MANTQPTHFSRHVYPTQPIDQSAQQPRSGVGQDNPAPPRDRIASPQPAPPPHPMQAHRMNSKSSRSQKRSIPKRRTVQLNLWVHPLVKAEIQRIAAQEGVSVSKVGAAFLEKAIQHNLHSQHTTLLDTVIEKAIGKHMRAYSNRHAALLVRSLFTAEQARIFAYNILGRQPGMSDEELTEITTNAQHSARANITRITPQMQTLVEAVTQWLTEEVNDSG